MPGLVSGNTAITLSEFGTAVGGGIKNSGGLTLFKSPVTANTATGFDANRGGIFNVFATFLTPIDSPVTRQHAQRLRGLLVLQATCG